MRIAVFGPPGSGKSTQGELLAKDLGVSHLQTGELSRRVAREETALGRRVKKVLETGDLVSDEDMRTMVENELTNKKYETGVVLDGVPRTLYQAKTFKLEIDRAFYFEVGDEENIKRLLLRKRSGETRELIQERLRIYCLKTEPMLAYYQKKGILERIDGERQIEVIYEDVLERLKNDQPKKSGRD